MRDMQNQIKGWNVTCVKLLHPLHVSEAHTWLVLES